MNHQSWRGVQDSKFGYGSMLAGFMLGAPNIVSLSEKASVDIYMGVPFACGDWLKGQHRVCFTMWESTRMPSSFARSLGWYDQILVPCQHNVELFSGFHADVKMVPLGVDDVYWCPQPDPTGPFRFAAGGSLWSRKGLDVVVKAFNRLKLPDAELHIKAAPHARDVPPINFPNVFLHRQWMTVNEQREWFAKAHVWVAPARGEGFGLMPLQAISMGIPTILSDTSGQKEFKHLASGVIPCRKSTASIGGLWDEPDEQTLTDLMVDHYQNWVERRRQALTRRGQVAQFSWVEAVNQLVEAVPEGRLLSTRTRVPAPTKFTAVAAKPVKADIAGRSYQAAKGETLVLTEGAYQVLYDAGMLEV